MDSTPQELEPSEAHRLLQEQPQAVLVDVRSTMEYLMIGHPVGAVHIPWLDEPDWAPNPRFVVQVRELMLGGVICDDGECPAILLICRSGRRSMEAGKVLLESGFNRIYSIKDGFEGPQDEHHHRSAIAGWRHEGLPWEQN